MTRSKMKFCGRQECNFAGNVSAEECPKCGYEFQVTDNAQHRTENDNGDN